MGEGIEREAQAHRLWLEPDREAIPDLLLDMLSEGDERCARRAPSVDEREGVFTREPGGASMVTAGTPGLFDEPSRRELHAPSVIGPARELAPRPLPVSARRDLRRVF